MKYFKATARTPHPGEELTDFFVAESEEQLFASAELYYLIEDCVAKWFDADKCKAYGFESPADYEEYYFSGSSVEVREITKEELTLGLLFDLED